jgi:DNA replication ATP-dependent helicase Dna2
MLSPGQIVVDRYRIVREIGHGGFGRVFLAEELERQHKASRAGVLPLGFPSGGVLRRVAIKVLTRGNRLAEELIDELRTLCALSHPNIVSVFDYAVDPACIVMEHVAGEDLHTRLERRGPCSLVEALAVGRQVAEALAHAHSAGILHRDVKPSNVIVDEQGWARLVDFGLARRADRLGQASTLLGTPGFVAPEILDPDRFRYPVGYTADVYGFGCLLYTMLLGQSPFASDRPAQTLRHQLDGQRESLDGLHPLVRDLVERATALVPSQRFPSMGPILERLHRIETGLARADAVDRSARRRVDLLDAQILEVSAFHHDVRGDGVKIELGVPSSSEVFRGFVYDEVPPGPGRPRAPRAGATLFESLSQAWSGAELSLFGAIELDTPKGRFLTGDDATVPVLEPHLPLSVTEVVRVRGARAGDCASRRFVDLRERETASPHIFKGKLIHLLLDGLVKAAGRPREYAACFDEVLARVRIDAIAAGERDATLGALRADLEPSFRFLARFVAEHLGKARRLVEVTRISGRYGLEGRIDLALATATSLDIVELKSGRHQNAEHEAQLRCYALLWDLYSAASGVRVDARLLYSRVGLEKAIPRSEHDAERAVLRSRNALLAAQRGLAAGLGPRALPAFEEQPARCSDAPCRFRAKRCAQQSATLGVGARPNPPEPGALAPDPLARAYYWHFAGLVEREYLAQTRAIGELTRTGGLAQRVEQHVAIRDVTLAEWDEGLGAICFGGAGLDRFAPGSQVIAHRGDPDLDATVLGWVAEAAPERLVVTTEAAAMAAELPRAGWILERMPSRMGHREAHQALYGLVTLPDPERVRAILHGGGTTPRAYPALGAPRTAEDEHMNAEQRAAVAAGLAEDRPLLIHGPPGTGKTTVVASLVERLVARGQRVLVAAGTNTAVDNILVRLGEREVDFLRMGELPVGGPLARSAGRDALTQRVERLLSRAEPSLDAIEARLLDVPVIAGTAHRCASSPVIDVLLARRGPAPFDVAIVDEATQLSEPLALAAIIHARRFVLVGDARQLPPVVAAEGDGAAAGAPYPRSAEAESLGLAGLDRSLFERLAGRTPEAALRVQYRMSEEVQALSNTLYYGGTLRPDEGVRRRRLPLPTGPLADLAPELRARLDPEQPVVWETLPGPKGDDRLNPAEVRAVVDSVAALVALGGPEEAARIGVISPFRAQCFAIRSALAQRLGGAVGGEVEVDTVERFQGRQKEVVFVSLVVTTWSDFVMDDRRLNVAFSRARSKLVVFGPAQLWHRFCAISDTLVVPPLRDAVGA